MIKMVLHDQHVHCLYSQDSNQPLRPYIEQAILAKCAYFVTTDHVDIGFPLGEDWLVDFDAYFKKMNQLQKMYPQIQILKGIELGYMRTHLIQMKSICECYPFDLINLSIHNAPHIDFYKGYYFKKYGIVETLDLYFNLIIEALNEWDHFQVLSHVDYGFKTAYLIDSNLKIADFEPKLIEIFKLLIKKGKALELNTKVQSFLPLEHTTYLLKLYYQMGGRKLTLSSDAHEVTHYRYQFDKYLKIIKEVGFTHLCYYVRQKEWLYAI